MKKEIKRKIYGKKEGGGEIEILEEKGRKRERCGKKERGGERERERERERICNLNCDVREKHFFAFVDAESNELIN